MIITYYIYYGLILDTDFVTGRTVWEEIRAHLQSLGCEYWGYHSLQFGVG